MLVKDRLVGSKEFWVQAAGEVLGGVVCAIGGVQGGVVNAASRVQDGVL